MARVCWALAMAAEDLESVARFLRVGTNALQAIGLQRRARPQPSSRAEVMERRPPAA